MQNKFIYYISAVIFCLGCTSTYAASNASLWGTLDTPVAPVQQIEHEQKQLEAQQQALDNQKTICELISGQTSLSGDTANVAKIREALQQAYKTVMPDYKMFLVSAEAANDLYAKYRDLYMQTYCGAPKPQRPAN